MPNTKPGKKQASVCGLYCGACSLYIGTTEDPERLQKHSRDLQLTPEEVSCHGCRTSKRALFCRNCRFLACAAEHEVEFCGECPEYPCPDLQKFQAEYPHRNEIWNDLKQINELGVDEWLKYAEQHYSCPECHTINSAYSLECRKCGHIPASDFSRNNKKELEKYLKKKGLL